VRQTKTSIDLHDCKKNNVPHRVVYQVAVNDTRIGNFNSTIIQTKNAQLFGHRVLLVHPCNRRIKMRNSVCVLAALLTLANGFVVVNHSHHHHRHPQRASFSRLLATLPNIGDMRIGEIRQELESYGISTKSFLEKKEMVAALEKARDSKASAKTTGGAKSREERIKEEVMKANEFKVGDLKKKLQEMGIPTKSFFEKPEFVKAYAEAVVDGVSAGTKNGVKEEPFDPSYRDVAMQKFDPNSLQARLGVIDVSLGR
jgi:hypothetical protein